MIKPLKIDIPDSPFEPDTQQIKDKLRNILTMWKTKEYPSDEPQRRCPDLTIAKNNLNYLPEISLKEGLTRHFSWFKHLLTK